MQDEGEPQGVPSSGTPPGPPPPWTPRRTPSTSRTGRVQEAEAPQTSNVPAPKWQGWKTQTGPTIADMEQSRMSPFGEPESEMPDPDLREAMIRSLRETRRDPHETPISGGASGSRATAQHVASPLQARTPKTHTHTLWHLHCKRVRQIHNLKGKDQSSLTRPPRIASAPGAQPSAQMQSRPITPADVCVILEDRIIREKKGIA